MLTRKDVEQLYKFIRGSNLQETEFDFDYESEYIVVKFTESSQTVAVVCSCFMEVINEAEQGMTDEELLFQLSRYSRVVKLVKV